MSTSSGRAGQIALDRRHVPAAVVIGATLIGVAVVGGLSALVALLIDALPVLAVLAAALGLGGRADTWAAKPATRPMLARAMIAIAIGLGFIVLATLALGCGGWLNRSTAIAIVALGIAKLLYDLANSRANRNAPAAPLDPLATTVPGRRAITAAPTMPAPPHAASATEVVLRSLLVLLCVPSLVILLFGATLPPGILWPGEAGGYDALEYHLQAPREYFESGAIRFLPHNVYAQFPQQVEMLYLLLMHLRGGAIQAAISAQLMHAALGILAVVAIGAWSAPGWPRLAAMLFAATTPWLAYVGCLAYVECGMLFFAAVAAGLVIEQIRRGADAHPRVMIWAGWCAGMAAGCKYTAIVLVAVGLAIALFVGISGSIRRRATFAANLALGAALLFSPWAIRNTVFTGNPVYPFAYSIFGGTAWSEEQARQWSGGHEHRESIGVAATAARELLGSTKADSGFAFSLFGPAFCLVGAAALLLARQRAAAALATWTALMLAAWMLLTHMPGRFVTPILIPLALAVGLAAERLHARRPAIIVWLAVAACAALSGSATLLGEFRSFADNWHTRTNVPLSALSGDADVMRQLTPINTIVPEGGLVCLIGDAAVFYIDRRMWYTVVFNRDPWLAAVERLKLSPVDAINRLRVRQVTHLVINPAEVERLRRTYGFSPIVTREWIESLVAAGLRPISQTNAADPRLYFELPRDRPSVSQPATLP